jgi:5-methylcytosine-specific restriction endonuclease McrA
MKTQNSRCLVLNADYIPLAIISWKRAIVWSIKYNQNYKYGIQIVDFYKNDYILASNYKKIPIPAVARMSNYKKISNFNVTFSRKNLFIRDNHTCQYCGDMKEIGELTYDHVIPKSQWDYTKGTPTSWTNVVTACIRCNWKKGNNTPSQAYMPLLSIPIKPHKSPKYLPLVSYLSKIREDIPPEWSMYLPQAYLEF